MKKKERIEIQTLGGSSIIPSSSQCFKIIKVMLKTSTFHVMCIVNAAQNPNIVYQIQSRAPARADETKDKGFL